MTRKLTDKERIDWLWMNSDWEWTTPRRSRPTFIARPDSPHAPKSLRQWVDAAIRAQRKALLKAERIGKGKQREG